MSHPTQYSSLPGFSKGRSSKHIATAISTLLQAPGVTVGQGSIVAAALERYQRGTADFGDYMILCEGQANGAPQLTTFDQRLSHESDVALVP